MTYEVCYLIFLKVNGCIYRADNDYHYFSALVIKDDATSK